MTRTDAVLLKLQLARGGWVDGRELADVGGFYAWRSRVSDARKAGHRIENRQRKVGAATISEYRLALPEQAPLFGDAA